MVSLLIDFSELFTRYIIHLRINTSVQFRRHCLQGLQGVHPFSNIEKHLDLADLFSHFKRKECLICVVLTSDQWKLVTTSDP